MNIDEEFGNSLRLYSNGGTAEMHRGEDGMAKARPQQVRMGATGMDLQPPIRREMRQAEGQTLGETASQIVPTAVGLAGGATAATLGTLQDIGGLIYGGAKAMGAEEGERLQTFLDTATEISDKYGSGAVKGYIRQQAEEAGLDEAQLQVLDEAMMAGEFGGIGGLAKTAVTKGPQMLSKAGDVVEGAGDAAKARMAEGGTTLTSGVDPDPLIAAAGDAVAKFRAPTEKEPGIIAFHGSGADFDEFKLEKIGTGEGAQAYGYGLYFTDSEDIAKFYRQTVGGGSVMKNFSIGDLELVRNEKPRDYSPGATPFGRGPYKKIQDLTPEDYAQAMLVEDIFINEPRLYNTKYTPGAGSVDTPKSGDELKDELIDIMYDTLEKIDEAEQPEHYAYVQNFINKVASGEAEINFDAEQLGKTYKVAIEPNPEDMLDYQAPFKDQPKKVQDALKAIGYEVETDATGMKNAPSQVELAMNRPMPVILDDLKKKIAEGASGKVGEVPVERFTEYVAKGADRILSEKLLEQGVPGIKYRAAGSRAANVDAADVEHNYVIFDDKMIKILEKYGIVGPVAVTGVAASQQESEPDAGA